MSSGSVGRVVVAIVGYRNPGDIAACLAALERSVFADFEVMICENGGSDAFEALKAGLPERLAGGQAVCARLAPRNLGFAGGVNACLEWTPGAGAWWVLNPDTEPQPQALANMVERLSRGDCDAVGCTVYHALTVHSHGGRWAAWLARSHSIGYGSSLADPVDPATIEREQNYLIGASMLISRRFLEVVGPMVEDYFLYDEEIEWCVRARRMGLRLGFAPDALVSHARGTTTGAGGPVREQPRMPVYLDSRNKMLLTADLYRPLLPVAAVGALALIFLRYARRGAWRQTGYAISGWWAGLRGRRGVPPWMAA